MTVLCLILDAHNMNRIESLDDPRVALYRNVRERDLRREGVFIAEGALLVERLLRSRFSVESIFVSTHCLANFQNSDVPIFHTDAELMRQIVGFDFHRGALAIARRLPFPDARSLVAQTPRDAALQMLACPATETAENLGLILRSARAFETDGVLLPTDGADPLSRRCLRQSMGGALSQPIAQSADLLRELREDSSLQLVAAVAGEDAVSLSDFVWPRRTVLVVGNEFQGLDDSWLAACHHRVSVPIAPDCDSLNVAVATGILLHHLRASKK